jgi:hypothetical protein
MEPVFRKNGFGPTVNKITHIAKHLKSSDSLGVEWTKFCTESWIFLKYLGQEFMVKFTEGLEYTVSARRYDFVNG